MARPTPDTHAFGLRSEPLSWHETVASVVSLACLLVFCSAPDLGSVELGWLLEGRGLLPRLADAWLGLAPRWWILRLPLAVGAAAGLVMAVRAVAPRLYRPASYLLLAAIGFSSVYPVRATLLGPWGLGLLLTGGALALGGRPGALRTGALLGMAAVGAALDPGLALAPLSVALVRLLPRRDSPYPALLALAGSGLVWLLFDATREISTAPLPGTVLALALAAVLALPGPAVAFGGAALLLLAAITSWNFFRAAPPEGSHLAYELKSAGIAETGAKEVLAGPGLTPGSAAFLARGLRLHLVERPSAGRVALLELASARPAETERRALEERLGDRVLQRSVLAGDYDLLLRFNVYRPVRISIAEDGSRPNIAVVSVDTLRADALPFYGYERDTAPALARWSEEALVYERAFAPATKTAPSFASLMTGRLPVSHGLRSNYDLLDPGHWTLARVLREAGYHTAAFVSSFVLTRDNCGLDLGFEVYDESLDRVERRRSHRPLRLAPELAEAVEGWSAGRLDDARPWFLWIHAIDPHGPYTPLPEFEGSFRSPEVRLLDRESIPDHQWLDTRDFSVYRDAYDAEILQTDHSLGGLLDALRALPSPEGLIVIFVADHGESFGERDVFFQHGQSLHQEQARVPLVIQDSAFPAAGREPRPVSLVDLMPTLLGRLGIETDLPLEGLPLGRRLEEEAPVLGGWRPGEAMALRLPWKLHLFRNPDGEEWVEVFDLLEDPEENRPLPPDGLLHGELLAAARALLDRDPLKGTLGQALRRGRWEGLSPEEMEQLRALGYMGP